MDITLWIVLGSLIGVVVLFIAGYSFFDRRKRRKAKTEVKQLEFEIEISSQKVVIFMHELLVQNTKVLANFVPSIGELKMSDIKNRALAAISALENSREFQMIKSEEPYLKIVQAIRDLRRHTANTWDRSEESKLLSAEHAELKEDLFKDWRSKVQTKLAAIYRGENITTLDDSASSTPDPKTEKTNPGKKKFWKKLFMSVPRSPHAKTKN